MGSSDSRDRFFGHRPSISDVLEGELHEAADEFVHQSPSDAYARENGGKSKGESPVTDEGDDIA